MFLLVIQTHIKAIGRRFVVLAKILDTFEEFVTPDILGDLLVLIPQIDAVKTEYRIQSSSHCDDARDVSKV